MTYPITVLHYHQHALEAVEIDGQKWLRVSQIVMPLGLRAVHAITMIFTRNEDEFTAEETRLVTLETDGGPQEMRLFSLRGARLLAILAKTPQAKAFRRWILDLLEGRVRSVPRGPIAPLPTESQIILRELANLPPDAMHEAITGYLTGRRSLPDVGPLMALRMERQEIVAQLAKWQVALRGLYTRARRLGYRPETLRWQPPAQAALGFDGLVDATE